MTYSEFCEIVRDGIEKGVITTKPTIELNDIDLAVQYAIGQEMKEQGCGEMETTTEKIYFLIGKHCGADVQKRIFPLDTEV